MRGRCPLGGESGQYRWQPGDVRRASQLADGQAVSDLETDQPDVMD